MKIELQQKLFDKYPELFRQKDLSMQETCMCWGIECGDGWYGILDNMCALIMSYCRVWKPDGKDVEPPQFIQVKEKYGTLRVYTSGGNDATEAIVDATSAISDQICETCGGPGYIDYDKYWLSCTCKKCERNAKIRNICWRLRYTFNRMCNKIKGLFR